MQTYKPADETLLVPTASTQDFLLKIFFVRDGFSSVYTKEKNEIISQLYVRLMEKLNLSTEHLELSRYYRQGNFDIKVKDKKDRAEILIETVEPEKYEKEKEEKIKELFKAGRKESWGKTQILLYWTHSFEKGKLRKKYTAINFKKFKTFADWEKRGSVEIKIDL